MPGFGSGMHEILWCLLSAYYNNQTVILIPKWSLYFGGSDELYNSIFEPLSRTCDYKHLPEKQLKEIKRPNTVFHRKLINQLPKEFGEELMAMLDSPNSWFHSQFIGYIMRPKPKLQTYLDQFKRLNNFGHPIVGIQVRRSDKLRYREALFYPISDYMTAVKAFFDKLELTEPVIRRLVYVSSDDPSVLPTIRKQYFDYEFIGSELTAKLAQKLNTRYTNSSLWGILTDVFLLSETNYIVCTFSSAVSFHN